MTAPQPLTRRLGVRFVLTCLLALTGCRAEAPVLPDSSTVAWASYHHAPLGVRLDVPVAFGKKSRGDEVAFTYNGTAARLVWVTEEEARERGLWPRADHHTAASLGGRGGFHYVYDHPDGPVLSRTIAYVVPHRGRLLGLEFRTDADTLGSIGQRMLESFSFDAP